MQTKSLNPLHAGLVAAAAVLFVAGPASAQGTGAADRQGDPRGSEQRNPQTPQAVSPSGSSNTGARRNGQRSPNMESDKEADPRGTTPRGPDTPATR
jgi:hypothetical protein